MHLFFYLSRRPVDKCWFMFLDLLPAAWSILLQTSPESILFLRAPPLSVRRL
jgi:hypothetical protein